MNGENKSLQQAKILEYFDSIVQLLPAPIYLLGLNQEYLCVNKAFLNATNTKSYSESLANKTPCDLYNKDQAKNITLHHQEAIKTKKTIECEEMAKSETLEARYYKVFISPLCGDNGEIIGTVGISIDITAEKNSKRLEIEKETAMQASRITKEWTTGLMNQIFVISSTLNTNSDELYKTAIDPNKPIGVDQILSYTDKTKRSIRNIGTAINLAVFNLKKTLGPEYCIDYQETQQVVAIGSCIDSVLKEFVFQNNERNLVKWNNSTNDNFICNVDTFFIKQMLFSFIENALIIIRKASYGDISIGTLSGTANNSLFFKISGSGISTKGTHILTQSCDDNTAVEADLSFVFNKALIRRMYGGDLIYNATEGTEIVITVKFPVVETTQT